MNIVYIVNVIKRDYKEKQMITLKKIIKAFEKAGLETPENMKERWLFRRYFSDELKDWRETATADILSEALESDEDEFTTWKILRKKADKFTTETVKELLEEE